MVALEVLCESSHDLAYYIFVEGVQVMRDGLEDRDVDVERCTLLILVQVEFVLVQQCVVSRCGLEGLHLGTPAPRHQLVLGVILLVQIERGCLWVLNVLLGPEGGMERRGRRAEKGKRQVCISHGWAHDKHDKVSGRQAEALIDHTSW